MSTMNVADGTGSQAVEEAADVCALPLVERTGALLDLDDERWEDGQPLPRGWHFLLFTARTPQSELPADGFPAIAGLQADQPYKIMLGTRNAWFDGDIPIGSRVRRTRRIVFIRETEGRSGRLVIVRRLHELTVEGFDRPSVREEEDMIYRQVEAEASSRPPVVEGEPPRQAEIATPWRPTETMLFRYSALTYNAHRIHYDLPYAREVEGYPERVVNGGLTSLSLLQLFRSSVNVQPTHISARNVRPLFCGEVGSLKLASKGPHWDLWAENGAGQVVSELSIQSEAHP